MNNESLIKQLKSLKMIGPDPVFLKWSRKAIITATTQTYRPPVFSISQFINTYFKYSLPAGAVAIVLAVLFTTLPNPAPTNTAITSLNNAALQSEKEQVAAHDQTTEVQYYKSVSPNVVLALNDIADPSTNWGSSNHLKESMMNISNENNN